MPSWGEILNEINSAAALTGVLNYDSVRRKYLALLHGYTGRSVIVYATDFVNGGTQQSAISLGDMQGMMEVCRSLPTDGLDIILHSPGGSPEATDSIVKYLRTKFNDIRVFVPLAAMSAGTMWALSSNRIVMGKHSQLGPIDPQISIEGRAPMPSRTIVDQFERAKAELAANPNFLAAWAPIIKQYGPGILEYCIKSEELAKRLVEDWLTSYMFSRDSDAAAKAHAVAEFFANNDIHKSHSIGISRDQARSVGVIVDDLEDDPTLQDLVLSVHHAVMITLTGPAIKLIENHLGRLFVTSAQQQQVQLIPRPNQPAAPRPPNFPPLIPQIQGALPPVPPQPAGPQQP